MRIPNCIIILLIFTNGILLSETLASPSQGEFSISAEIIIKHEKSGYDLHEVYQLKRGENGYASGGYNNLNPVSRLDFDLTTRGPNPKDSITIRISIPHFNGVGNYPVPTILNVTENDPNKLNQNVLLMITNWKGSLYDKQKVNNKGVLQFRSNWYYTDRRTSGKVTFTSQPDIGGIIKISKVADGWVSGELQIILYNDGEQIPFMEGDDINTAVIKGTFEIPVYNLDKL